MVGRTEPRTKADDERFEIIREIGCIASAIVGWPGTPCQVHHLLEGYRIGHQYTIGLSPWHHEGQVPDDLPDAATATERFGPSLAREARAFHARFGSDEQLLTIQDALIRLVKQERRAGGFFEARQIGRFARLLHAEIVLGQPPNSLEVWKIHGCRG